MKVTVTSLCHADAVKTTAEMTEGPRLRCPVWLGTRSLGCGSCSRDERRGLSCVAGKFVVSIGAGTSLGCSESLRSSRL